MSRTPPQTDSVSRADAIVAIRRALLPLVDEETSMCQAAANLGIFCRGFKQFGDNELRRRYEWIVRKRPDMTREDLEQIANDWQLAQQQVEDVGFACDVQTRQHDTCGGWDDFTNEQLSAFYRDLTGQEIRIA